MVRGIPPTNFVQIDFFKIITARWRNQFSMSILVKLFLAEIARPNKKYNTSCLKNLALEPLYLASYLYHLLSQYDHDQ